MYTEGKKDDNHVDKKDSSGDGFPGFGQFHGGARVCGGRHSGPAGGDGAQGRACNGYFIAAQACATISPTPLSTAVGR